MLRFKPQSIISLVALAAILVTVIWLLPRYLAPVAAPTLSTEPDCDLGLGACSATEDGISLALELAPYQATALEPLHFQVRLKGASATAVTIYLEGRDMYMGLNSLALVPSTDEPGLWLGTTALGICTTGEMVWQATVEAHTAAAPVSARYEFSAR
jgi:hypothetical protein